MDLYGVSGMPVSRRRNRIDRAAAGGYVFNSLAADDKSDAPSFYNPPPPALVHHRHGRVTLNGSASLKWSSRSADAEHPQW